MASGYTYDHHHGHGHRPAHDHDHASELRALVATTLVVGLLLGLDLVLASAGLEAYRKPFSVSLALLAAIIGGGVGLATHQAARPAEPTPAEPPQQGDKKPPQPTEPAAPDDPLRQLPSE